MIVISSCCVRECVLGTYSQRWLSQILLAEADFPGFLPGNPVVSRSLYTGTAAAVTVGQKLPPTCPATATCPTATATNNGTYPNVWLNAKVDGSFGITTPIFLDQISAGGALINTYAIPPSVLVTSLPSKSEVGLNLVAGRLGADLYGLCCSTADLGCVEFEYPGSSRSDKPGGNELLPRNRPGLSQWSHPDH